MAATTPALRPELQDLVKQLTDIKEQARGMLEPSSPEVLRQRPSSGGWSVTECLEHLNITARTSLAIVEDACRDARQKGILAKGPYRPGFLERLFTRLLEPPIRLRIKTPKAYVPVVTLEPSRVYADFLSLRDALIGQLERIDGLDLNRLRVRSPFEKWLSYSVYGWLLIMAAHERRHLWQAQKVLQEVQPTQTGQV
jgi:hypothetical protein